MIKSVESLLFLLCVTLFVLTSCGHGSESDQIASIDNDKGTVKVAVSIMPQKTFVEKVGGNFVDIHVLVPPGYSPEQYEPSPQEMIAFEDSDVYFSIDVPVEESQLRALVDQQPEMQVVSLVEAYKDAGFKDREFTLGSRDPHAWLSPQRVMPMVKKISEILQELDPDNAEYYQSNTAAFLTELHELDVDLKSMVHSNPQKTFIVYHPAFGYIAEDYGMKMVAIEEEGQEANPAHLREVIDLAKAENIKVIFYQSEMDSRQAEAVAEEINGVTAMLKPLSANYIENLQTMIQTMATATKS